MSTFNLDAPIKATWGSFKEKDYQSYLTVRNPMEHHIQDVVESWVGIFYPGYSISSWPKFYSRSEGLGKRTLEYYTTVQILDNSGTVFLNDSKSIEIPTEIFYSKEKFFAHVKKKMMEVTGKPTASSTDQAKLKEIYQQVASLSD